MSLKYLVLCAMLLVAVVATPVAKPMDISYNDIIQFEDACIQQGGVCARVDDCDPDNFVRMQANLCPKQQHLGVKCCYQLVPTNLTLPGQLRWYKRKFVRNRRSASQTRT